MPQRQSPGLLRAVRHIQRYARVLFRGPAALHRINVERQTPNVAPLTDFQGLIEPVEDALRAQAERFWLAMEVSAFGSGEL